MIPEEEIAAFINHLDTAQPAAHGPGGEFVPVRARGLEVLAQVDSGNTFRNVISPQMLHKFGYSHKDLRPLPVTQVGTARKGSHLKVLGELRPNLQVRLGRYKHAFKMRPVVVEGLSMDMNISLPYLRQNGIDQLHTKRCLRHRNNDIPLVQRSGELCRPRQIASLVAMVKAVIKPGQSGVIPMATRGPLELSRGAYASVNGDDSFVKKTGMYTVHHKCVPLLPGKHSAVAMVPVHNPTSEPVTVEKGLPYGTAVPLFEEEGTISTIGRKGKELATKTITEVAEEGIKIAQIEKAFRLHENPHLNERQREEALRLLVEYWDVFSFDGSFGKTDLVEHAIYTKDHPPIKCRYRPLNPHLEANLRKQLDEWLEQGVIEESNSPWSFQLVAVPKKNGKIRWCVDYRRLNDITIKDAYPLPHIEDNLSRLVRSKWFSGIDGSGAFHVVSLRPKDREKTAFATPWGSYHFRQMPFGLSNGPATYSRLVQFVLAGIPPEAALPYLDDTVIHANTFETHVSNLRAVFDAHRRAGLKLQPPKCQLFQKKILYLGHEVSEKGIRPNPEYVKIVAKWPLPTTRTEVRSFLGKVGYYRRFLKDYATIAAPLHSVTSSEHDTAKDDETLTLTPDAIKSFHVLREALTTAPVLAYPDFSGEPFILDTDWSSRAAGIGATLLQKQRGKERVIAYGGVKLRPEQRNYGPTKGELFAALYFMKRWRYYLQYRPFILRTDHSPLKAIRRLEAPSGLISRWFDALANFNFNVMHRAGAKHTNADALSRAPHLKVEEQPTEDDEELYVLSALFARDEEISSYYGFGEEDATTTPLISSMYAYDLKTDVRLPRLPADWRRHQWQDPDLRQVVEFTEEGTWPEKGRCLGPVLQHYYERREQLHLDRNGVLQYQRSPLAAMLPCIPKHLQEETVRSVHRTMGHKGENNTSRLLSNNAHFPQLSQVVREVLRGCDICARAKPHQRPPAVFAPVVDGHPFQRLSLDFVGPLPRSSKGNYFLLTVKDTFTRWVEAFPLKRATAAAAAECLQREIFARYCFPESIHSDRGRQFTSGLIIELARMLDIHHTFTPSYNPKSNPVERFHRDLKHCLRTLTLETKKDWEEVLPHALMATRITPCRSTGFSPFQMLFGRDPSIPLAQILPTPTSDEPQPLHEVVLAHKDLLTAAHDYARRHLSATINRQRRYYRHAYQHFQSGDLVWLFTPLVGTDKNRKLDPVWTGPWTVDMPEAESMYRLLPDPKWSFGDTPVVARDRLKKYFTPRDRIAKFEPPAEWTLEDVERRYDENAELFELPSLPTRRDGTNEGAIAQSDDDDDDAPDEFPAWWPPNGFVGPPAAPAPAAAAPPAAPGGGGPPPPAAAAPGRMAAAANPLPVQPGPPPGPPPGPVPPVGPRGHLCAPARPPRPADPPAAAAAEQPAAVPPDRHGGEPAGRQPRDEIQFPEVYPGLEADATAAARVAQRHAQAVAAPAEDDPAGWLEDAFDDPPPLPLRAGLRARTSPFGSAARPTHAAPSSSPVPRSPGRLSTPPHRGSASSRSPARFPGGSAAAAAANRGQLPGAPVRRTVLFPQPTGPAWGVGRPTTKASVSRHHPLSQVISPPAAADESFSQRRLTRSRAKANPAPFVFSPTAAQAIRRFLPEASPLPATSTPAQGAIPKRRP